MYRKPHSGVPSGALGSASTEGNPGQCESEAILAADVHATWPSIGLTYTVYVSHTKVMETVWLDVRPMISNLLF